MDVRFCFVVLAQLSNPLRVLSKTQLDWIMNIPAVGLIGSPPIILAMNYWPLVIGYWLWDIGYWVLAMGDWLFDMGGIVAIRAFTLYTLHSMLYTLRFTLIPLPLHSTPYALHFTLKATATMPLTFRLIAL